MTDASVAAEILAEFRRARIRHKPMRGPHEGYAVLLEEVDELWDEVKANRPWMAREEAIQVGAMALAFALEVNRSSAVGKAKKGQRR